LCMCPRRQTGRIGIRRALARFSESFWLSLGPTAARTVQPLRGKHGLAGRFALARASLTARKTVAPSSGTNGDAGHVAGAVETLRTRRVPSLAAVLRTARFSEPSDRKSSKFS